MTTPIDRESVERLAYRLSKPQSAIRPTISDSRDGAKTIIALRAALDEAEAEVAELKEWKRYWSAEMDVVLAGRADEYDRAEKAEAELAARPVIRCGCCGNCDQ